MQVAIRQATDLSRSSLSTDAHESLGLNHPLHPSTADHWPRDERAPVKDSTASHPANVLIIPLQISTLSQDAGACRAAVQKSTMNHPIIAPTVPLKPSTTDPSSSSSDRACPGFNELPSSSCANGCPNGFDLPPPCQGFSRSLPALKEEPSGCGFGGSNP